jgi:hypothetical protein
VVTVPFEVTKQLKDSGKKERASLPSLVNLMKVHLRHGAGQAQDRHQAQREPVHRKPDPCIPLLGEMVLRPGCGAALQHGFAKAQIK